MTIDFETFFPFNGAIIQAVFITETNQSKQSFWTVYSGELQCLECGKTFNRGHAVLPFMHRLEMESNHITFKCLYCMGNLEKPI